MKTFEPLVFKTFERTLRADAQVVQGRGYLTLSESYIATSGDPATDSVMATFSNEEEVDKLIALLTDVRAQMAADAKLRTRGRR